MQPFETLSYEEQLQCLQPLVESVLQQYGLDEARYALLQYEDNAVYRVTARTGADFVLRVNSLNGHCLAAQRSEMQWLLALRRESGLRVPEPLSNRAGDLVTLGTALSVPEPRPCVLLSWLPGELPAADIEPVVVERIGAFTAQLHRHAELFVLPVGFVRPAWDWERLFGAHRCSGTRRSCLLLHHVNRRS